MPAPHRHRQFGKLTKRSLYCACGDVHVRHPFGLPTVLSSVHGAYVKRIAAAVDAFKNGRWVSGRVLMIVLRLRCMPASFGIRLQRCVGQTRSWQTSVAAHNSRGNVPEPLQARNLDVTVRGAAFLGAGIPLARRSVLPTAHLAPPRRPERRGIPWESRGIQGLAFPVGACPAAANRRAIGDCGTSARVAGLVARLHPSAGRRFAGT